MSIKTMFAFALACAMVTGVPFCQTKKTTVAVIDFNATSGLNKTEVVTLTNRFRVMLVQTNAFSVIERNEMEQILKEQDFILSDNCNTSECAVEVGQLLGAEQMIAGDIGKVGDTWTTDLRLIDISTGKIVKTQSGDYEGKIDGLLEIMREIAFVFAGLKKPGDLSIVRGRATDIPLKPARIRLDIRGGMSGYLGSPAGTGEGGEGFAAEVAVGYLIHRRVKLSIELRRFQTSIGDTITLSDQLQDYSSTPGMTAVGLGVTFYLLTEGFRPYLRGSVGRQNFNSHLEDEIASFVESRHGLENRGYGYFSPSVGFEMKLSQFVDVNFQIGGMYTKPWDLVVIQGGLSLQFGNRFKE